MTYQYHIINDVLSLKKIKKVKKINIKKKFERGFEPRPPGRPAF